MKPWGYVLIVLSFTGWVGASAVHALAAEEAGGASAPISASEAVKIAEKEGRILSLHRHEYPKKRGHYYRITVVESSENEVKDLYIDAKTGKVLQRIEHPVEMPPGQVF